jgi:hypothetical protein
LAEQLNSEELTASQESPTGTPPNNPSPLPISDLSEETTRRTGNTTGGTSNTTGGTGYTTAGTGNTTRGTGYTTAGTGNTTGGTGNTTGGTGNTTGGTGNTTEGTGNTTAGTGNTTRSPQRSSQVAQSVNLDDDGWITVSSQTFGVSRSSENEPFRLGNMEFPVDGASPHPDDLPIDGEDQSRQETKY